MKSKTNGMYSIVNILLSKPTGFDDKSNFKDMRPILCMNDSMLYVEHYFGASRCSP